MSTIQQEAFWSAVKNWFDWPDYNWLDYNWNEILYRYRILVNPPQDIVDYMSSLIIFKGFADIGKAAVTEYNRKNYKKELERRKEKIKKLKKNYNLKFKYKSCLKHYPDLFIKELRKAGDDPKLYTKVYKKNKHFDKLIECWENNYLSIKECAKRLDLSYQAIYSLMKKFNLKSELDLSSYHKYWPFRERYFFKQEEIDRVVQDPKFQVFKDELEKRKAIRAIKAII